MVLVPVLLLGSVTLGLRIPGIGVPGAHSALAPPDYSRSLLGAFAPLRDSYIADVLGAAIPRPTAAEPSSPSTVGGRSQDKTPRVPPVVVEHQLVNDDFSRAYPVASVPFTARTNTSGATRQSGEPTDCAPLGGTVWYRIVAPADIGLIVDTYGTDRAVALGVFSGNDISNLVQVGCATHARGNARVAFPATQGTTYYFQVAPITRGTMVFSLRRQGLTTRFPFKENDLVGPLGYPSPDGRFIAFTAYTPEPGQPSEECVGIVLLMPAIPGSVCRIQTFVYDRRTQKTMLVSVSSDGNVADDTTIPGNMSADGRHVILMSYATNLVGDDTNRCLRVTLVEGSCLDVFVHDRDADGNGIFDETFPAARKTVRVSVSSDGTEGNATVGPGLLSLDGRYVTFQSWASNLVEGDTNGVGDVFTHDRDADGNGIFDETFNGARRTFRVSVSSDGAQTEVDLLRAAHPESLSERRDYAPIERGNHIIGTSANGRYAMFRSPASNLVPGGTNGAYHVYIHDILTGKTTRVSVDSQEREADRGARLHNFFSPKVSDDGRFAIFNSDATNLVPGDTNGDEDLFVRDLVRGTTERVTVTWDGRQAEGEGLAAGRDLIYGLAFTAGGVVIFDDVYTLSELNHTMTPDGRYVFFSSGATNLVPGDENEARDIFVRDLYRGTTTLVSVSTSGAQGDASSNIPVPTADGRLVSFYSLARNLDETPQNPDLGLALKMYLRTLPGGP